MRRKHIRIAAAVLTGVLLILIGPLGAFAAMGNENEARFDRQAGEGNEWSYVGVKTYGDLNDLFGEVTKNLAPGAEKTVTVRLGNESDARATFSLRAEALTGDGAKALESEFKGKEADDALLSNINIAVSYQGTSIYAGTLRGAGGTGDLYTDAGAALGTLEAGNAGTIEVTLSVSRDLDNRYFNKLCAVNWTFTATQEDPEIPDDDDDYYYGDGPGTPGAATPLDDGPLTDIGDEDTPLATLTGDPEDPDLVVIADPDTPLALPQTGGLMTYATPAALALAVLLALYAVTYIRGRKKADKPA